MIFPNPVKDAMTVTFYKNTAGSVTFRLLDVSGKTIKEVKKAQLPAGEQSVLLNVTNGLTPGVYVLQINDGEKSTSHKVIVE